MRRRTSVPKEIHDELPFRGMSGHGHDHEAVITDGAGNPCPADMARRREPTAKMVEFARDITAYLHANDATQMRAFRDIRNAGHPGELTLCWSDGPAVAAVAEHFATSRAEDGTPLLPSWIALRSDTDFDLRWQPPY